MLKPERDNTAPQDAPATYSVPAPVLLILGSFFLLLSVAMLVVTASFIKRGPSDRSGIIPAFLSALTFGCTAFYLISASRRPSVVQRPLQSRINPQRIFWFRAFLLPFFVGSAIGALINGSICVRLINQEYLHWLVLEPVENWVQERSSLTYMIETGVAAAALMSISLLLYFVLFVKSPTKRDSICHPADQERISSNPFSPPEQP
jgi:formate hydrogenlyase subunit 3/multisubunit Na+/H+ antiporter MnhD subunit